MHEFTDTEGRIWRLKLTLGTAVKLRDHGWDLVDDDDRTKLLNDPYAVLQMTTVWLQDQIDQHDLDAESFADTLTSMFVPFIHALVGELALFCRSLGQEAQAQIHEAVLKAQTQAETAATRKLIEADVDSLITRELDKAEVQIDQELSKLSGQISSDSPGSSELLPTP